MKKYIPIYGVIGFIVCLFFVVWVHASFTSSNVNASNSFAAAAVFPTPTPIPVNAGDVVINEINWAGSNGDGNDEWVELRNTTNHAINLNNWVIDNLGTGSGPGANLPIASA